jgi:hypothetical protein
MNRRDFIKAISGITIISGFGIELVDVAIKAVVERERNPLLPNPKPSCEFPGLDKLITVESVGEREGKQSMTIDLSSEKFYPIRHVETRVFIIE